MDDVGAAAANLVGLSEGLFIPSAVPGAQSSLIGGAADDIIDVRMLDASIAYFVRSGLGADSVAGGDLGDDINGNQGDDFVSGGAGDDWVLGGQGDDLADGGSGADLINGNLGADTCQGGDGEDTIRGGQSDDMVAGGAGGDQLFGDIGSDTFEGGAGADVFHAGFLQGEDVIEDFNNAEGDRIELEGTVEFSAAQVGADIVVTVLHGSEVATYVTEVIVRNASLELMSDGWITD